MGNLFAGHLHELFLVAAIFFGAGVVKGVIGMGLPTFALGFLGLMMPVARGSVLLTLPSLVTNFRQAGTGGAFIQLFKHLWPMQVGIFGGIAVAALMPTVGEHTGRALLGGCLVLYGMSGLAGWRPKALPLKVQRPVGFVAGALSGIVTGFTGVFVIPAVPYLQSLQLDRHQLSQALGINFTTSTIALAILLQAQGQFDAAGSLHSAFAVLPALAGMWVGQKMRAGISEASFRRWFFAGLVALGAWLLVRW
jgi:uncharacterized membrane protein YfcA